MAMDRKGVQLQVVSSGLDETPRIAPYAFGGTLRSVLRGVAHSVPGGGCRPRIHKRLATVVVCARNVAVRYKIILSVSFEKN